MREHGLTIAEIALIAGTRLALGVGLGLLLADRLGHDARRTAGWALFLVGLVSTPVLLAHVFRQDEPAGGRPGPTRTTPELVGAPL
jgi:hypothetical protein